MNLNEKLDEILGKHCWLNSPEGIAWRQGGMLTGQRPIYEHMTTEEAKEAIKQLILDELEKIIDYINTDTNDVCWKHSPEDTPMIHSSRVEYLKDYVEQKIKELKDGS